MEHTALVVEDEPEVIDAIVEVMDSLGHDFVTACSQHEAMKRLGERSYSYVLADIGIPARSRTGTPRIQNTENLLEKMSQMGGQGVPPVIIMSDYAVEGLDKAVDLMRLAMSMHCRGAVDVIAKPFPQAGRTLDRVIKKALGLNGPDVASIGEKLQGKAGNEKANPAGAASPNRPSDGSRPGWLTATKAAKLLMHDLPGLSLAKARSRISTAAGKGEFESSGIRRSRRIEPHSFASWRLKQRDRDLDREDELV